MELLSCCGLLSLQVGVAMVSILYWLIGSLTFVVNFFDFLGQKEFPFYAFPIMLFVILFISAGSIAYAAAFRESRRLCNIAAAVMGVTLLLFLVFSAASFINSPSMLKYICVHNERCPESFWLASLRYRGQQSYESDNMNGNENDAHADENNSPRILREFKTIGFMLHDGQDDISTVGGDETKPTTEITTQDENHSEVSVSSEGSSEGGYVFDLPFYGAIFLFLSNCIFLVYTTFLVWSYGKELLWVERFLAGAESDSE